MRYFIFVLFFVFSFSLYSVQQPQEVVPYVVYAECGELHFEFPENVCVYAFNHMFTDIGSASYVFIDNKISYYGVRVRGLCTSDGSDVIANSFVLCAKSIKSMPELDDVFKGIDLETADQETLCKTGMLYSQKYRSTVAAYNNMLNRMCNWQRQAVHN